MRQLISLAVLAGSLAFVIGSAQALPTQLGRTTPKVDDDGRTVHVINNNDVMICKYTTQAGTRIPLAVCHTALEWKHIHDYSREYLEDINRGAGYGDRAQ